MKKIFGFIMIGTNNLATSSKFYDLIFAPLDLIKVLTTERYIGYAQKNIPGDIVFYITKPFNKEPATYGNGTQISLLADSKEAVDKFHQVALNNGARNEGSPGIRSGDYYAYIRDPDGNKICAYSVVIN
jgi:catechol 2,3-dioxygenase-like lactoylglutathione lyase family enzyme|tara:strand:- start:100 stop:486 length:387 start_codon:yes stop_codon:yes gene_type:complete